MAATKYVTLETLLKAAGADFTPGMTVTAADATGFGSTLSYQDYQTCRWYIDGSGVKSDAPAARKPRSAPSRRWATPRSCGTPRTPTAPRTAIPATPIAPCAASC